jgi:prepilin-type N-terminal cleavage/methylation domain-containing protein
MSAGFTLVELMVALALAALISVAISLISTTARRAYTETTKRVDVYNRFRLVFSTIERDFSAWIATQELEFYIDGRGGRERDFHWDPGEEVPDSRDDRGPGQVNGGMRKGVAGATSDYDEFAYILQRQYQSVEPSQVREGDRSPKLHDAYQVYFKTLTFVDGAVREATVEYMLVDTGAVDRDGNPVLVYGAPPEPVDVKQENVRNLALYKVVRYFVIDKNTITNINQYPIRRRVVPVATNVTDFRLEYVVSNPYRTDRRGSPRFVTPEEDYKDPSEDATRPQLIQVSGTSAQVMYRKHFGYGSVRLDAEFPRATAFVDRRGDQGLKGVSSSHEPVRFGFRSDPRIAFAELTEGDRIFVFTENSRGGGGVGSGNVQNLIRFPAGDYTVKSNLRGQLEFLEDIDTSTWADKDQPAIRYKAAYLPAALRITIRMVDDEGENPKTMQQVVWLRRKAR